MPGSLQSNLGVDNIITSGEKVLAHEISAGVYGDVGDAELRAK